MTTYTFNPKPTQQLVNWSDPSVWIGGVVPASPDADVIFPTVTTANGLTYVSTVTVAAGENFSVDTVSIRDNRLDIKGSLSANDLALLPANNGLSGGSSLIVESGASLSVGSIENDGAVFGAGQILVSGFLFNNGRVDGNGLTLTAGRLNNRETLAASGGSLTVNVSSEGFENLAGSRLNEGTYLAGIENKPNTHAPTTSTLFLNVGSTIVTDAGNMLLYSGGDIASFDPGSSSYTPIESSLRFIATNGTLSLVGDDFTWGDLTVDGTLVVAGQATLTAPHVTVNGKLVLNTTTTLAIALPGADLFASQLTIGPSGQVSGTGSITGSILNSGIIFAGSQTQWQLFPPDTLVIDGAITGGGTIKIAPHVPKGVFGDFESATLELKGAVSLSQKIAFSDGTGTLILDNPASFSGVIAPAGSGDAIVLAGIALNSVTGYSYSGDASGGTLTVQQSGTAIALHFLGHFSTPSFHLAAGPGALSSSPPSLVISVTQTVDHDFDADGRSDFLWQNDNGTPAVWLINGTGIAATSPALANPGPSWHEINSADFNGDGKADILFQNNDGTPAVWLMNGINVSSFGPPLPNPGPAWHAKEAADFNADGKADILFQNDNGTPAVWLMNGTGVSVLGPALPNPGPSWHEMAAADFNGDGKADILWQNDNGTPAVWLMNGTSVTSFGPELSNPGTAWHALAAGDFNGDGKADILWQNSDGTPAVWLMSGTDVAAFGPPLPNPGPSWHEKEAADFNGDGKADILWQNDNGTPAVWLMNGTGVLAFGPALSDPGMQWHII